MENSSEQVPIHCETVRADTRMYITSSACSDHLYNGVIICSGTIMMLMRIVDPEGTERCRRHRLKRRIYQNKV